MASARRLAFGLPRRAPVAIANIADDKDRSLRDEIREQDGTSEYWHPDVTSFAQVCGEVAETLSGIDVVVTNAGISGADKPTDEIASEEWRRVMDVNVNDVFHCTRAAVPHLRDKDGGSIVNPSSIYGIVGAPTAPRLRHSGEVAWRRGRLYQG